MKNLYSKELKFDFDDNTIVENSKKEQDEYKD